MKAYKIDLSGFTGKVREVVNQGIIAHAGKIGYLDAGKYTDAMLATDCLAFWKMAILHGVNLRTKRGFLP